MLRPLLFGKAIGGKGAAENIMNDIKKDFPQEEELNKAVEEHIVNEMEKVDNEVKAGARGQSTKSKGRSQTN